MFARIIIRSSHEWEETYAIVAQLRTLGEVAIWNNGTLFDCLPGFYDLHKQEVLLDIHMRHTMKESVVMELWKAADQMPEGLSPEQQESWNRAVVPSEPKERVFRFAKALMMEAAKTICFHCRDQGPSVPGPNPHTRYHMYTGQVDAKHVHKDQCKAPTFYFWE